MAETTCRGCGKPMVWVRSAKGRAIPCDPPVLAVVTDAGEVVRGRISHFATCADASRFRKSEAGS